MDIVPHLPIVGSGIFPAQSLKQGTKCRIQPLGCFARVAFRRTPRGKVPALPGCRRKSSLEIVRVANDPIADKDL